MSPLHVITGQRLITWCSSRWSCKCFMERSTECEVGCMKLTDVYSLLHLWQWLWKLSWLKCVGRRFFAYSVLLSDYCHYDDEVKQLEQRDSKVRLATVAFAGDIELIKTQENNKSNWHSRREFLLSQDLFWCSDMNLNHVSWSNFKSAS